VLVPVAVLGGGCWLVFNRPVVPEATARADVDSALAGSLGAINPPLSSASGEHYNASPDYEFRLDLKLWSTGRFSFGREQFVYTDIVPAKFAEFRDQEERYWRSHGYTDIHSKPETDMGGDQQYVLSATSPGGAVVTVNLGETNGASADVSAYEDGVKITDEIGDGGDLPSLTPPGPRVFAAMDRPVIEDPYWSH
jgi:hypothetical protein